MDLKAINFKNIINKILYPNTYSSDALIKWIRKSGGVVGERCIFYDPKGVDIDKASVHYLTIGNDVHVTKGVTILAHDYAYSVLERVPSKKASLRPQTFTNIGNNVFIGIKSIILPGTTIGDNVIIGAGSVVSGVLESNAVYGGNPARHICSLEDYLNKMKERFRDSTINFFIGEKRRTGSYPNIDDLYIYKTMFRGYEHEYNSINYLILEEVEKFKNIEEIKGYAVIDTICENS